MLLICFNRLQIACFVPEEKWLLFDLKSALL